MKKKLSMFLIILFTVINIFSATSSENGFLKVYLDCNIRCDTDYIKKNISFAKFVNDRFNSDFHLIINTENTGGGGEKYHIIFLGNGVYSGEQDTSNFVALSNQSDSKTRQDLVKTIKAGLLKHAVEAGFVENVNVEPKQEGSKTVQAVDKWNNWVFEIGLNGNFEKEESNTDIETGTRFEARRITKDMKFDNTLDFDYEENRYFTDSSTVIGRQRRFDFFGRYVKSIGSRWSLGVKYHFKSSSYSNLDLSYSLVPAIEYNIYPYSKSSSKLFTINYGIGYKSNDYIEETIFGKMKEKLVVQQLESEWEVTKSWGEINLNLEAQTYLHDLQYNHLSLGGHVSFDLFSGFSLSFYGDVSRIQDQINLPLEEGNKEDVLLETREQATDYSVDFGIRLNYTFGSIYNDVVNARF